MFVLQLTVNIAYCYDDNAIVLLVVKMIGSDKSQNDLTKVTDDAGSASDVQLNDNVCNKSMPPSEMVEHCENANANCSSVTESQRDIILQNKVNFFFFSFSRLVISALSFLLFVVEN